MSCDDDSDDDNQYELKKKLICLHSEHMSVICEGATKIVGKYCSSWIMKNEPRKSILTGFGWLQETIGTPGETFTMFRMKTRVFFELHDLLVKDYGLGYSPFVSSYESLAMFLWTLGGVNQIEGPKTVSNIHLTLSTASSMRYCIVWSGCLVTTSSRKTPIFTLCIKGSLVINEHIHT